MFHAGRFLRDDSLDNVRDEVEVARPGIQKWMTLMQARPWWEAFDVWSADPRTEATDGDWIDAADDVVALDRVRADRSRARRQGGACEVTGEEWILERNPRFLNLEAFLQQKTGAARCHGLGDNIAVAMSGNDAQRHVI